MNTKPKILIVDDKSSNRFALRTLLKGVDAELHEAENGFDALSMSLANDYALILLDVQMPEMDGFEVCEQLRADPRTANTSVIFLTAAYKETEDKLRGYVAGATDYLAKPIEDHILKAKVQVFLKLFEQQRLLQENNRYLQIAATVFESHEGMCITDAENRVLQVNQAFTQVTGYHNEEIKGINFLVLKSDRHTEKFYIEIEKSIELDGNWSGEAWILHKDRHVFPGLLTITAIKDASGKTTNYANTLIDITERKQVEEKLQLAASVFTCAREGIMITAVDGTILNVNDAFSQITSYTREEVLGNNPHIFSSGRQDKTFYAAMWSDMLEKGYWKGEIWNRRKNGDMYAVLQTISVVNDAQGKPCNYISLMSDITKNKDYERELYEGAHYDALTRLPNRMLLADRLQQGINQTQRREKMLAVVFLDLDGFKEINDKHGHGVGDQLLIAVANRMRLTLREGDTLARIGGDEFVAELLDLDDIDSSMTMLNRLLVAASEPFYIDNLVLHVTASLGVTYYPQEINVDADQLLRQADQAMYQAKQAGKNRYHIFDAELDRSMRGRYESLDYIRLALRAGEFIVYYQPKVNMRLGTVVGVEALIRWQHPEKGLLLPAAFLPIIENHPLSVEMGQWVINTALSQIALWQSNGINIPVSVNVCANQLEQDDFVESLRKVLDDHPTVSPSSLTLEVLESSALKNS